MKFLKYRIPLLVLLFLAAFGGYFHSSRKNAAGTGSVAYAILKEPELPVVWAESCGRRMDVMRGYLEETDADIAADTLIILPADRKLALSIEDGTHEIRGIRYEIRSTDLKDLLERTEVKERERTEKGERVVLPIQNLVRPGREYRMEVILSGIEYGEIHYYARVMLDETGLAEQMVTLAEDFSSRNFDYEAARENTMFLETNETGDNTTLGRVDLKSNFTQLTYGKLELTPEGEADIRILEYNGSMGILRRTLSATGSGAGGSPVRFRVTEDFVMRKGPERIYMMDYTRSMQEVFTGTRENFAGQKLMLGISGEEGLQAVLSPDGMKTAFVSAGDLWLADPEKNGAVRVWSFRSGKDAGFRADFEKHGVEALSCTDEGDVLFLVYGYMNRGDHEGRCGISVMQYDRSENTVSELSWLASGRSYEEIAADMKSLSYFGANGMLYLKLGNGFYGLDTKSGEYLVISSRMKDGTYAVSPESSRIAWQDTDSAFGSPTVHFMNLDTGSKKELTSEEGQVLKPVGFIGNDLAVGIAETANIRDINGIDREIPFTAIEIVDDALESQAHYEESGFCLSNVYTADTRIHLTKVVRTGGHTFRTAGTDTIVCNEQREVKPVILSENTELREKTWYIPLQKAAGKNMRVTSPSAVTYGNAVTPDFREEVSGGQRYTAYGHGKVLGSWQSPGGAVNAAYDAMGYVRGGGSMLYCRAATAAIRTLRGADNAAEQLLAARETGKGLDLYGAEMRGAFYFVSRGKPVMGWSDGGVPLVIAAYDQATVLLYSPQDGTWARYPLQEAEAMFRSGNNDFLCLAD